MEKPANPPDMPISVSLILSLASAILKNDGQKKQLIQYCESRNINLWMSQADIDTVKEFLFPELESSRFKFSEGALESLRAGRCKE